ncbi:MAG: S8 family serine peptidase [Reichenbachiella sp.]|uniref:S8 family serine peptidase n=1 Tax=Reichenbachiella sp. TaxID=2184521 RepID=UPI0032651E7B
MERIYKVSFFVGLVMFFSCGGDPHEPPVCLTEDVSDHHLVIFRCSSSQLSNLVSKVGGAVERVHEEIGVAKVSGLSDRAARKLQRNRWWISAVSRDIEVDWLRQRIDEPVETTTETSLRTRDHGDPTSAAFYNFFQWGMKQIGAGEAWSVEQGDEQVRVAIIDSGISPDHLDLSGRYDLSASINLSNNDPSDLEDRNGHGTLVSGVISTNNIRLAGLAPHTTMVGVKVLQDDGSGNFADLIGGIMHAAVDADADIINISFGSHFSTNFYRCQELRTAILCLKLAVHYAKRQGKLIVAAAGDGDEMSMGMDLDANGGMMHVPSQLQGIYSVGATTAINQADFDSLASYSNYGFHGVDVVAPGGNDLLVNGTFTDGIFSTVSPYLVNGSVNRYNMASGTGIAAAHVSALAALISAQNNESLTVEQLKQKINETADDIGEPGRDKLYGNGRINAHRAVTE